MRTNDLKITGIVNNKLMYVVTIAVYYFSALYLCVLCLTLTQEFVCLLMSDDWNQSMASLSSIISLSWPESTLHEVKCSFHSNRLHFVAVSTSEFVYLSSLMNIVMSRPWESLRRFIGFSQAAWHANAQQPLNEAKSKQNTELSVSYKQA